MEGGRGRGREGGDARGGEGEGGRGVGGRGEGTGRDLETEACTSGGPWIVRAHQAAPLAQRVSMQNGA
jgi:hypothetical protein